MEPGAVDPLDPLDYRRIIGRFATGVAVVTTHLDHVHHAITVNSFTSVSLEPVLVLVCIEQAARFHAAVLTAGAWGVSVLSAEQAQVSRWFATRGRPLDSDHYAHFRYHTGRLTGALLFDEALAQLECRTLSTVPAGDHTIVVGEVLSVSAGATGGDPLLFFEGRYHECSLADSATRMTSSGDAGRTDATYTVTT